jgi:D-hydroxyproline dehydrogenase subunit beta
MPGLKFDDAVAGAGIVGLATAYLLARRGRRVVVFERSAQASGASVRNFGMLWPIGQPAGPDRSLAFRSLEIWSDVLRSAGLWHDPCGSLHLAYRDDEARVLDEFARGDASSGLGGELIGPETVGQIAPAVRLDGLRCAYRSPTEVCVDPREVVAGLPGFLAKTLGVRFEFGRVVVGFDRPSLRLGDGGRWSADRLWVCSGSDLETLYPEVYREQGVTLCKLQMLRTEPVARPWRLGPMLAAGLTLRHYRSFEGCPSLASLRERVARETPQLDRFGIHVMASQNGRGEVVVGDSHEYGKRIQPFDRAEIEALILDYLRGFLDVPGFRIAARWNGIYAKHPTKPSLTARPAPGVSVIACLGGAGMTLSFGIAEQAVIDGLHGDER